MVNFRKQLEKEIIEEWKEYYIDYEYLHDLLEKPFILNESVYLIENHSRFFDLLNKNLTKVETWYFCLISRLQNKFDNLSNKLIHLDIYKSILQVESFCDSNKKAVYKIIKFFDKNSNNNILDSYLQDTQKYNFYNKIELTELKNKVEKSWKNKIDKNTNTLKEDVYNLESEYFFSGLFLGIFFYEFQNILNIDSYYIILLGLSLNIFLYSLSIIIFSIYKINYIPILDLNYNIRPSKILCLSTFMLLLVNTLYLFNLSMIYVKVILMFLFSLIGIYYSNWNPLILNFKTVFVTDHLVSNIILFQTLFSLINPYLLYISFLPLVVRIIQCSLLIIKYKNYYQFINIIKYTVGLLRVFFPILNILNIILNVLWDTFFDWGIKKRKTTYPIIIYGFIVIINIGLRSCILFLSNNVYLLIIELIRRFLWSVLRVEYFFVNAFVNNSPFIDRNLI